MGALLWLQKKWRWLLFLCISSDSGRHRCPFLEADPFEFVAVHAKLNLGFLSTTATTGYLAAEEIHQYLQQEGSAISTQPSKEDLETKRSLLSEQLQKTGVNGKEVLRKIQELVLPYNVSILKSEKSLNSASFSTGINNNAPIATNPKGSTLLIQIKVVQSINASERLWTR